MQSIAKLMQIGGLITLPLAMYLEATGNLPRRLPVAGMLIMMVFGFCLFQLGRYLEGYAAKS